MSNARDVSTAGSDRSAYDRYLIRLKNLRVIAIVLVVGIGLIGLGEVTGSIGKVIDFIQKYTTSSPPERVWVDHGAAEITELYRSRTTVQADVLFDEIYAGKWIRLEMAVEDVIAVGDHVRVNGRESSGAIAVRASFAGQWRDKLTYRKKGEAIAVAGRLHAAQRFSVELHEAELVESAE